MEEENKNEVQVENNKAKELERECKVKKEVKEQVIDKIIEVIQTGINNTNLDELGKLVDIHKDLSNEEYWKVKEEVYDMNYNDYNEYGRRGVPGSSRGRYGRRGVPGTGRGRYGHGDPMEEMKDHYEDYNDASYEMDRGNYGAENEMLKSVEGIMKNVCEIVEELSETGSPEVTRIIKKYAKKMSEMD